VVEFRSAGQGSLHRRKKPKVPPMSNYAVTGLYIYDNYCAHHYRKNRQAFPRANGNHGFVKSGTCGENARASAGAGVSTGCGAGHVAAVFMRSSDIRSKPIEETTQGGQNWLSGRSRVSPTPATF